MLKNWLLNIGLGLLALLLLGWLTFLWMGWYTHHNTSIDVPNLQGLTFESATVKLDDAGLRYEIIDSVYNPDMKKDAITEQDPLPGSKVKPNRIIYIIVNSLGTPKVKVPRLVDQSFTLAKALLKSNGLVLGEVTYKYDEIGHNLVMSQKMNGRDVPAGKMVEKGTKIDLVVATNKTESEEPAPDQAGDDPAPSTDQEPPAEKKPAAAASGRKKKNTTK